MVRGVNSKQMGYMTLVGIHSPMQITHPNQGHVTAIYIQLV